MKKIITTLFVFLIFLLKNVNAQTDSFLVDGVYRNFILHIPAGYNASVSHPLVLNLHGYTSNAGQEELYTKMDAVSDTFQFIVVYPNGIGNYWNSFGSGADDVKFLSNLIDTISARYKVNAKRVYSCGMSNGGFMSYTLACQLSSKIAAIASVTGTLSTSSEANCAIAHKMPVLDIHGTADPVVNYSTGVTGSIGVEQTIAFWRDTNGCTLAPDTTNIPNTNTTDGCTVQKIHYKNCKGGSEVIFYKVTGGGHTWPSSVVDIPNYGNTNHDFEATNVIWEFFSHHSLDDATTGISDITKNSNVKIYPNPFSDELKIATDEKIERVEIFDVLGNKVMEEKNSPTNFTTKNLAKGIYLAKIILANTEVVKRIVKE